MSKLNELTQHDEIILWSIRSGENIFLRQPSTDNQHFGGKADCDQSTNLELFTIFTPSQ
jgi:hypothetical protein